MDFVAHSADGTSAVGHPCPFDPVVHLMSPPITPEIAQQIEQLRKVLEVEELYQQYLVWCTDPQLHRFLIARNYDINKTREMVVAALKWRVTRIPVNGVESLPNWMEKMSKEGETGKIYIPGYDKYHRPVLVFDNTVQNTSSADDQLSFLAWYLEYACRLMPVGRDKYVVFMHLEAFSFFNCPPMKTIMETIFMVCNGFPERLGHCIAYRAPGIFKTVFNGVKSFIDQKTVNKLVFITGDVSEGSENDLKIKEIIGDDWRVLCGGEQPIHKKGNTPGYIHEEHWPFTMKRYQEMIDREQSAGAAGAASSGASDGADGVAAVTYSLSQVAIPSDEYAVPSELDNSHFTIDTLKTPKPDEVPEDFAAVVASSVEEN